MSVKRDEAVEHGNADLKLGNLTTEVSSHGALAQQLHMMRLCLDATPAVISAPFMDGSRVTRVFVAFRRLVGCGHLFGVEIAARRPRALMKLRVSPWIPINGMRIEDAPVRTGYPGDVLAAALAAG